MKVGPITNVALSFVGLGTHFFIRSCKTHPRPPPFAIPEVSKVSKPFDAPAYAILKILIYYTIGFDFRLEDQLV